MSTPGEKAANEAAETPGWLQLNYHRSLDWISGCRRLPDLYLTCSVWISRLAIQRRRQTSGTADRPEHTHTGQQKNEGE